MLRKAFKSMDRRKVIRLSARDLLAKMARVDSQTEVTEQQLNEAIEAVNAAIRCGSMPFASQSLLTASLPGRLITPKASELTFRGFEAMILGQNIENTLSL